MYSIWHLAAGLLFTACMRKLNHQAQRTIRRPWLYTMRDVTPKTTEQNRIVRTGKSEAEVTRPNNKKTALEVL